MTRILLVEDDKSIVDNLTEFLETEGFVVTAVGGQEAAISWLDRERFDLMLLDISLPDGSGYAVCAAAKAKADLPVIFLTASDDEFSVVAGFDMGADDYVSKPFRPRELVSRIKNVLRRRGATQSILEVGDVQVDTVRGLVLKRGEQVFLSALEYRLLLLCLNNKGLCSRARPCWKRFGIPRENTSTTTHSQSISSGCAKKSRLIHKTQL